MSPHIEQESPASILDQDLYKFCMQQAILEHYPNVVVEYGFVNRDPSTRFSKASFEWLRARVMGFSALAIKDDELEYLRSTCPYLSSAYLEYLSAFRFNPEEEVACSLDEATGELHLRINGRWSQVILYEVPLLSLISEAYFKFVDTDWNYDRQREHIVQKGKKLAAAGCRFAEFGTRRRRNFKTQDIVMSGLMEVPRDGPGLVTGTSNMYLARKYGVSPVGTVGHEWTMGIAALEGTYENGNSLALKKWHSTFNGSLGIALTDTFGTKAFFANFDHDLASKYAGVRHDSGDPFAFIESVHSHYRSIGIDPATKVIVFSDGLDPDSAIAIKSHCEKFGLSCSFGIGTNFTNDFKCASDPSQKSKAVNIVIKLFRCNDRHCVKLSDVKSKHTGNLDEVKRAQSELSLSGLLVE
ncbi:nicotinate phosphoribosyltransferase [Martensiomyces pterosporus]|nr:nicotinate phosphoribosyltransferase [Martensiomyces pterosporus]